MFIQLFMLGSNAALFDTRFGGVAILPARNFLTSTSLIS